MSKNVYDGTLFDYTAGCRVGVLVTPSVADKLAKLQSDHLDAVKRLLVDEAVEGNVFPSMWTLHYPNGKQTTVRYIDTSETAKDRIREAVIAATPTKCDLVFIAGSMDEAKRMADAHHKKNRP